MAVVVPLVGCQDPRTRAVLVQEVGDLLVDVDAWCGCDGASRPNRGRVTRHRGQSLDAFLVSLSRRGARSGQLLPIVSVYRLRAVLRGYSGPAQALRLILVAGLSLDLELVGIEDTTAILVEPRARPNRRLRPSLPVGVLVLALLLHSAESVRSEKILVLDLLLGQLLRARLEALAATGALALRLRRSVGDALALVALRLDLRVVRHVLEIL